ncbi:MAG: GIY-YIG nuclease family protein [Planctomycetota bacterium]|nr:GIY-YIG nuclease family protein [Planctomycetota bacterium]
MNGIDLLHLCEPAQRVLANPSRIKLVRHASPECDLEHLHQIGFLEEYQSCQGKEVFKSADFIISFLAESGSRSRFIGVYRVGSTQSPAPAWSADYPHPEMDPGNVFYDLQKVPGFESLEERLVIDWGAATRSWVQNYKAKPLIEVYPEGHVRDFPGSLEFILTHDELARIVLNPDANRIWHKMLGAVSGIYLITDMESGQLYVGSAYGAQGLIGRWTQYVKSHHGGNKNLIELLNQDPHRYTNFAFSILRTLPKTLTNREVIEVENLFKRKLGSRAFGLNGN